MHVVAVKPADENYRKMAEAYRACEAAGIGVPQRILEFFNHEEPDDTGTKAPLDDHPSCMEWNDDARQGFQLDITKLPEGTRFVRFYCSW